MQKIKKALNVIEEKISSIPYLNDFKPSCGVEAAKNAEETTTTPQQATASTTGNILLLKNTTQTS